MSAEAKREPAKDASANGKHALHLDHPGVGFRDPEEASDPFGESLQLSSEKLDTPAKRQYRDKARSSEGGTDARPAQTRESDRSDRRDARQERERSPRRDRPSERDRERATRDDDRKRQDSHQNDQRDRRIESINRSRDSDRHSGRDRERRISRDEDRRDDRRDDRRRDDWRDDRRGHLGRSASPPPRDEGKIGDFKNWVPVTDSHRGGDRRPRHDDGADEEPPELYAVLRGIVASVQSFGAFVRFEGKKRQGLVHVSQLSNHRVENPREMLTEGDNVWVKVVAVSDDDGKKKISLSMKLVNQTTGQDLDANNVALAMSQRKPRGGHPEKGPIELGYALPTTCTKCGGAGHMATECKVLSIGTHYELLPEPPAGGARDEPQLHRKEKKEKKEKHNHKKHKKEKKSKKHKKHQSSSDSSSSNSH